MLFFFLFYFHFLKHWQRLTKTISCVTCSLGTVTFSHEGQTSGSGVWRGSRGKGGRSSAFASYIWRGVSLFYPSFHHWDVGQIGNRWCDLRSALRRERLQQRGARVCVSRTESSELQVRQPAASRGLRGQHVWSRKEVGEGTAYRRKPQVYSGLEPYRLLSDPQGTSLVVQC